MAAVAGMECKSMHKSGKPTGFTLIELLVVVVIIGILAGIALPNFIGATRKSRVAAVRSNMHTIQVAAESAATDTGGQYPNLTVLAKYMPGGGNDPTGADGIWPVNPFTNAAAVPNDAGLTTLAQITAAKNATPGTASGTAGNVGYSPTSDSTAYGVLGYDEGGKALGGGIGGKQMVLSNQ